MHSSNEETLSGQQQCDVPQGKMEEKLANIWRELLDIDSIDRNYTLFELTGFEKQQNI